MEPITMTIGTIIAAIATKKGVIAMIEGVLGSYVASYIPLLKRHPNFEKSAKKCYKKAAKEWSKIDYSRSVLYEVWVKTYEDFEDFAGRNHSDKEWVMAELISLWFDNMRNDPDCRQLVVETELQNVYSLAANIKQEQYENKEILKRIEIFIHRFRTKGTVEFEENKEYIDRSCDEFGVAVDFQRSLGNYKEKSLCDFVLGGGTNTESHRFVLYSSMQTGKTTELEHAGWILQQSDIYQPVLISLSLVPDLKFEDLPEDDFLGHKPIVLLIDALDETMEDNYCHLWRIISNYVKHHPNMKIVVSSRANFRNLSSQNGFVELELLPMHWGQTAAYVKRLMPDKAEAFIDAIMRDGVYELANNPMTLKTMMDIFSAEGRLPSTQAELYGRVVADTVKIEKEKGVKDFLLSAEEEMLCMERTAGLMLLMNKRELSEASFKKLLKIESQGLYDHLRYDIVQKVKKDDGDVFVFKRNAYLEYMAARLLLRAKDMGGVIDKVCYRETDVVRNNWFGPMILWMEMVDKEAPHLKEDAKSWLLECNPRLAIHAPSNLIDAKEKGQVVINLLQQYEKEQRYFYEFGNDLTVKTRRFPLTVIEYLLAEWKKVSSFTVHLKNIQLLTTMIDWDYLRMCDKPLAIEFENTLYGLLGYPMFSGKNAEWIYVVMTNSHFITAEGIRRLFEIVKKDMDASTVEVMMSRIARLDNPVEYIDYIETANQILVNGADKAVIREFVYDALEKIDARDCPENMMRIVSSDNYWRYADDREKAQAIYYRVVGQVKPIVMATDGNNQFADLLKEGEKQYANWNFPMREQTEEEKQKSLDYAKRMQDVLFSREAFCKQAEEVMAISGDGDVVHVRDFFDPQKNPMVLENGVSHHVTNFLIEFASQEAMIIDKKVARQVLANEGLFVRYRLRVMTPHLTGGSVVIPLAEEQKNVCVETAKEVLMDMLSNPFNGRYLAHERVAMTLFVNGDIKFDPSEKDCKSLLRYVGMPLEKTNEFVYDISHHALLEKIRGYLDKNVFHQLLMELVMEIEAGKYDANAYNIWLSTLLDEEYSPAIEYVLDAIKERKHKCFIDWIPNLTKYDYAVDVLKKNAEKMLELLRNGNWGHADIQMVLKLCETLMKKEKYHDWCKQSMEVILECVNSIDAFAMRRCLDMLFKLGSINALSFMIYNPHVFRESDAFEFNYSTEESILPLVELYRLCIDKSLFALSYNSILESLYHIAMKSDKALEQVRAKVVERIPRFAGINSMTPQRWADRLSEQFMVNNQVVPTVEDALRMVCE